MQATLACLRISGLLERRLAEHLDSVTYEVEIDEGGKINLAGSAKANKRTQKRLRAITPIQARVLVSMLKTDRAHLPRAASPQSASDIASQLGCGRTTVQACLVPLLNAGLVRKTEVADKLKPDRRVPGYTLGEDGLARAWWSRDALRKCETELKRILKKFVKQPKFLQDLVAADAELQSEWGAKEPASPPSKNLRAWAKRPVPRSRRTATP